MKSFKLSSAPTSPGFHSFSKLSYQFISGNKLLDQNRISADLARLNNFYKNRGYYNAKIKSTTGIITEDKQFELIFNINAGEKFFFVLS